MRAKSGVTALPLPSDWPGLVPITRLEWFSHPRCPNRAGLGRMADAVSVSKEEKRTNDARLARRKAGSD